MSIFVHRNSFNAGEISPLMDARVDAEKYAFAARRMENFLPRVYGGAFRRPGTEYLGEARTVAKWQSRAGPHAANLLFGGEAAAPTTSNASPFFAVGSVWLRDVRTVYRCTAASDTSATWELVAQQSALYRSDAPGANDDTTAGFAVGSVIWVRRWDRAFRCTDASAGAAVWEIVNEKIETSSEAAPTTANNGSQGFETGSHWVRRDFTLYECEDATPGAAVWDILSGSHRHESSRAPLGSDDGDLSLGSIWIRNQDSRVWEMVEEDAVGRGRLLSMNISASDRYVIELGDGYAKIWNGDGSPFIDKTNPPYNLPLELKTPYSADEIFDVQLAQLGNLAYFCHPRHAPQRLARSFDASFASAVFHWTPVDWAFPAFRDLNVTEMTATPSGTTGEVTISFSGNPFIETMVYSIYSGARVMLVQRREAAHEKLALAAGTGSSGTIDVLGEYEVYTFGTFTGTLFVEALDPSGEWRVLRSFEATSDRQLVFRSATESETVIRLRKNTSTASTNATAYIESADSRRIGYARIKGGISFDNFNAVVEATVERDFDSTTATTDWAIESWADYAGFPRSVAFHEQRLWFGGTELQPNTFWASRINDFESFRRGSFDDDSLAFQLAAEEGSAIQSMLSHDALLICTQSDEWTATTSEQTAITPSNIFVRRQSRFGSAHRQAFVANKNILFLQRGGRKIREFRYSADGSQDTGTGSDVTMLAEHVTRGGVTQMAFANAPDPVVWAVVKGGGLIAMTFEVDQGVIAWSRHPTAGEFESVAVIYGDDFGGDEAWVAVRREIEGEPRLFIERIDPDALALVESGAWQSAIYCDAAKRYVLDAPQATFTGLGHIEGETVQVVADGGVVEGLVVEGGEITLPDPASVVVVGLPFTSLLQPSRIELEMETGTAQGRKWLCKRVDALLWLSFGLTYADHPDAAEGKWFPLTLTDTNSPLGGVSLFTGRASVVNLGSHRDSVDVSFRQSLPLPAAILSLVPKIEISGK